MQNLRLQIDRTALADNWRALDRMSGDAAAGAAVKADGYGLGAVETVRTLADAGCRDFFVAHWEEAAAVQPVIGTASLSVLHGPSPADINLAKALNVKPVLNTVDQVQRWRDIGGGLCDVMFDTGMNRLGLAAANATSGLLDRLDIDICMSHLASADTDVPQNIRQLKQFHDIAVRVKARRYSLANSAGIGLGGDYHFNLTRPGLALYGGVARPEMADNIRQVVTPQARILQVRTVGPGETIGYNATYTATSPLRVGVIAIGYADGYLRCFSGKGTFRTGGNDLPVLGRVSMDLVCVALGDNDVQEGDWVDADFALADTAARSGLSQYELLTGLGTRFDRQWI